MTGAFLAGILISVGKQKGIPSEMSFKELYRILLKNRYYIFSFRDLLSFFAGTDKDILKTMIYRWKGKGWISSLKKGLYELTYPGNFTVSDMYVANRLYEPSYISLETALSYHSVIPEVSMGVTSVTTKPSRCFKNKHGFFLYRTVRPEIFTGYYVEKERNFSILIAEAEKALVDFLYFKTYRMKKVDLKGERLDRRIIAKLSRKKIKKYADLYKLNLGRFNAYL